MANLNLDEILALFQNGERRYSEDPAFKAVADSLKMGLGVYGVLDHTLIEHIRVKENHINLIRRYSALESQISMLNGHIEKLNDEVASWKDANDHLQSLVDIYKPGL